MNLPALAFFTGLFGSLHCVGMCGPLAFGVPSRMSGFWAMLFDKLSYNAGRILSYSILGLILGIIGNRLWIAGLQQAVSIVSGILIVLAALSRLLKKYPVKWKGSSGFLKVFNRLFSYALKQKAGHFFIGVLNGFLPCGFVYLALVGALQAESIEGSVLFMFWFGLGTAPLMLLAMLGSGFLQPAFRRRINKVIPVFMLFMGLWFVVRGMNLDIPYLSPAIKTSLKAPVCH